MNIQNRVESYISQRFKRAKTKQEAVKGGKLNIVEVNKFIGGEDKLGRRVLWKKQGTKTDLLSTHPYSKSAGLINATRGNPLQEESDFTNTLIGLARKNSGSASEDVRSAAWYITDQWHHDDWRITEPLQNAVRLLAEAKTAGQLIE